VLRGGGGVGGGRRGSATGTLQFGGGGAIPSESSLHVDDLFALLDLSSSHSLPPAQVGALHAHLHHCGSNCPPWLVQQVLDASIPAGLCTRANVLEVLAQLSVLCAAQQNLRWDFAALDLEDMGVVSMEAALGFSSGGGGGGGGLGGGSGAGVASPAELLWATNDTNNASSATHASRYDEFVARKQRTTAQTDKKMQPPPREMRINDIQAELIGKPATTG